MDLITEQPGFLPVVVHATDGQRLTDLITAHRAELREHLHQRGALLFRGFDVGGSAGQEAAVEALSGAALKYTERSSPRHVIGGNVYSSTDYPPSEEIFLHNENSYQATWPMALYFHCVTPADSDGATPLADTRTILASIDPDVVAAFRRRGWMVARTYREDFGLSWRYVFDTDSRAEVERYCAEHGVQTEWLGADVLRTVAIRGAVHSHPISGAEVWFNHLTVFHLSTLAEPVARGLLEMVGEYELPSNTYYGDGGAIEADVLDHLRACYRAASVRFDYRQDDLLVIDNMLVAHGRESFTGPRLITVAMAEPSGRVLG